MPRALIFVGPHRIRHVDLRAMFCKNKMKEYLGSVLGFYVMDVVRPCKDMIFLEVLV